MLQNTDLSQVLIIDIETIPQFENHDDMPKNFQEFWELKTKNQRKEVTAEEFYPRAGIWAEFGKIICISCGRLNYKKAGYHLRVKSFFGDDEKAVLNEFCALLATLPATISLCAHNGKEFDFPYLCRRMLVNGIKIPVQLQLSGKKPWEVQHLDTMELWKFGDYKNYTSLNLLAAIFNIPTPKDDIDGSMVHEVYYKEKNLNRIVTYCQKDVITTAQLLLKFKGLETVNEQNITLVT